MDKDLLKKIENACIEEGDEAGFQFSITCPSCKQKIYSDFTPFTGNRSKSMFQKNADPDAAWNSQKRIAFQEAATEFDESLIVCDKCDEHVCPTCYLTDRGMCMKCCTDSAKRVLDESWHQLHSNNQEQNCCFQCGTKVGQAKFCPKCGAKQKVKGVCEGCSAKIPEEALFCPECGKKV